MQVQDFFKGIFTTVGWDLPPWDGIYHRGMGFTTVGCGNCKNSQDQLHKLHSLQSLSASHLLLFQEIDLFYL